MTRISLVRYFSIALILSFSACADSELIEDTSEDFIPVIYIAGVGKNQSGTDVATYWKDGKATHLSASHPTAYVYNSAAYAITVSRDDIYVAGVVHTTQGSFAVYWKNGDVVFLSDTYSQASSIVVSGGNVYVAGMVSAGNGYAYATYWKNGTAVSLTQGETYSSAGAITVVGNNVYVGGHIAALNNKSYAAYWKNGNATMLTDGTTWASINSLAVSGSDVFAAGAEYSSAVSVAKYWKNGHVVNLTDGSSYSYANTIALHGNDIYVAGVTGGSHSGDGVVTYWKNGSAVTPESNSANNVEVSSIALLDNDVYIVGNIIQINANSTVSAAATFWKNGVATTLEMGENDGVHVYFASSIFIVD